ncbi:MAG: hypothetical protein NVSMB64_15460 [Candidatus Velthaea sp.]
MRTPKPATYDVEVTRDPIADEVTAARLRKPPARLDARTLVADVVSTLRPIARRSLPVAQADVEDAA